MASPTDGSIKVVQPTEGLTAMALDRPLVHALSRLLNTVCVCRPGYHAGAITWSLAWCLAGRKDLQFEPAMLTKSRPLAKAPITSRMYSNT
jgi:hypothetical protein